MDLLAKMVIMLRRNCSMPLDCTIIQPCLPTLGEAARRADKAAFLKDQLRRAFRAFGLGEGFV
jgi:hypothetical protein